MNKKIIIALASLLIVCVAGSYFATAKIKENRDIEYNQAVYNYYKDLRKGEYNEIKSDIYGENL